MDSMKKLYSVSELLELRDASVLSQPLTIGPGDKVLKAITTMLRHDFSQLPVVDSQERVIGAISLRSILAAKKHVGDASRLEQMDVIDCLEKPYYVDPDEDIFELLDEIADRSYFLVGGAENLEDIVTYFDIVKFFRHYAEPFLTVGTVEQTLRGLISDIYPDGEKLDAAFDRAFLGREKGSSGYSRPESVDRFSLRDYRIFIDSNWVDFKAVFHSKKILDTFLEGTGEIRNGLFHFREKVDHEKIGYLGQVHRWVEDHVSNYGSGV